MILTFSSEHKLSPIIHKAGAIDSVGKVIVLFLNCKVKYNVQHYGIDATSSLIEMKNILNTTCNVINIYLMEWSWNQAFIFVSIFIKINDLFHI